jgi:hypothetical protein
MAAGTTVTIIETISLNRFSDPYRKLIDMNTKNLPLCLSAAAALMLAGCGGVIQSGNAPTAATGGAAGGTSVGANPTLERCPAPLGTLAVDDGRGKEWYASFGRATKITTIEPLIRLAVQQSNCFIITSIGNNRLESKLTGITDKQRNSGEFRAGSKQQKGQRVAADYFMDPSIVIDESPTGRLAGAVGGALLGGRGGQLIGAGMESRVSVVTLSLFDIRSSVQIAISEGNSTATNFGAALGAFGGGAAGGLSGSRKRRKARRPWQPLWMPTTAWSSRCETTRRRTSRVVWVAVVR